MPSLPGFRFENRKVKITTRQLASHTSGVRHYEKKSSEMKAEKNDTGGSDTELQEFYIKENFKTTNDALKLFIDDELLSEPGVSHY